jgi:hypothetical protein
MSLCATITVTAGPDRGKVFELTGEMARLGKSPENEVVLSDVQVGDHHASIVRREGRFAIYTSEPAGLEVDGTEVPLDRWVWLPETATIRVGRRTSVEFVVSEGAAGSSSQPAANEPTARQPSGTETGEKRADGTSSVEQASPRSPGASSTATAVLPATRSATQKGKRSAEFPAPGSDGTARPRKSAADRGDKKTRTIARFITDGPGDPLVKLGEDGHLPELALHETQAGQRAEPGTKQSNPVLLIVAVGISFGLTILMLFMDVGNFGNSAQDKARARVEIAEYYGEEGETLKPYQLLLREARVARSRRDYETERQQYRQVLAMLRSEDTIKRYAGLTGLRERSANKKSDERLEELIGILLSE